MSTYQVRSLEEADQIIKEHERKSKTYYALLRSTKNFGCIDVPSCTNDEHEVRFETVGVPYCSVPFFVAGLKILQCQSYKGRGGRKKKEIKIELTGSGAEVIGDAGIGDAGGEEEEEPVSRPTASSKRKKKFGRVHKVGCTATIIMKEVIYYPEFQLYEHAKNNRIAVARQLKEALKAKTAVQKDRIIYVTVPAMSDHFGHTVTMVGSPKASSSKKNGGKNAQWQSAAKRLYVKSDFYGHNEPGSSKRVYYPVKQEKTMPCVTKKVKVDLDFDEDVDDIAREVRELLQSIMGLTYKHPGTVEAYRELNEGLLHCKLKYQQSMGVFLNTGNMNKLSPAVSTTPAPSPIIPDTNGRVPPNPNNNNNAAMWTNRPTNTLVPPNSLPNTNPQPPNITPTTTPNMPVGSVGLVPPASSSTAPVATVVYQPAVVSSSNANVSTNGAETTNQENSIFMEAMEAILNSQVS